jgi:predicted GNAT family acetyltransferase
MGAALEFYADPAEFLAATAGHLAAEPVVSTVVTTMADRALARRAEGLPAPVPGRLVAATEDDVDLVEEWCAAFRGDADEQAGRPGGAEVSEEDDRVETLRQLREGHFWLWVAEDGRPVHLTGVHPPSYGVARVGPVYTPPAERGRGWASNAVAQLSRRILAGGARACLYTDQASPTSNKTYAALGYQPVVDMVNLLIAG